MKDKMKKHNARMVQYLATLSVSLVAFTVAVSAAWPTPVLPKFRDNETQIQINEDEVAWMMAMDKPGYVAGSLLTRFAVDRLGRRATVLSSALPFTLGSLLVSFALKPWLLYLTRFMWGIGTAMASMVITIYLNEIVDKEVRATLTLFTCVIFNLGLLLVMSIGVSVSYDCLNYMLLALPIIYFIACFWIPESPYYHMKEGRVDAARKELMRIRRCRDGKELEDELMSLQNDVFREMQRSSSVKELFTGRQYRKAIIVAAGLQITKKMTGMTMIRIYLGRIIQQSKSTLQLRTVLLVVGVVQFVIGMYYFQNETTVRLTHNYKKPDNLRIKAEGLLMKSYGIVRNNCRSNPSAFIRIMSSIISDRVGRRPLLYYSLFGTGLCLATISGYFFFLEVMQIDQQALSPYSYVLFAAIIGADVIWTLGYNSIVRVIPAEIFPMNVKAVALVSYGVFGGVLGFGMRKGYQEIVNCVGLCGAFCVFTGFCITGALFVIYYVPETKGKSLKEIQVILQGDIYNDAENATLNQVIDSEIKEHVEINELKEVTLRENKE